MKKIHIIRLGSVVDNGVGGPAAGCIDLIYSFLLQEYEMDVYSHIMINQIGDDLDEVILKEKNSIHINIKYLTESNFDSLSSYEQNIIRLDVVHKALLKIAEYDDKLDIFTLGLIRQRILDQNFSFYFIYKTHVNKSMVGKVIVHPTDSRFIFYCSIEKNGNEICKVQLYEGIAVPTFNDFFSRGKWKDDRLIIFGSEDKIEIHIMLDKCDVLYINQTIYDKHPRFELYRAGITKEEKEKAYNDWIHSLPPSISANIRRYEN